MSDYVASWDALKATDPEVADAIANELERERTTLRLIASENYASPAVLAAIGSTMNNKYAEGYPGRRYYGGCEFVDVTEQLAIDRAKELFGADHANVQPHAGAQANMAVFGAFLEPRNPERQGARDGARARRPPDARLAGQRQRHVVQLRRLRGRPRDRAARHGQGPRPGARAQAEDHPGRLHGVPARDRLRRVPRDRRRGRRAAVGRRVALHRAGRRRGVPVAGAARGRGDVHDAQGAARTARRHDPVPGGAREGDRQGGVPDDAGRAARALHRRQGRGAEGGDDARVQGLRAPGRADALARSRRGWPRRACGSCPAARTRT